MENIVIVEKLCEKLQESERPTDLGVAVALRVVLDENIILTERAEDEVNKVQKYRRDNQRLAAQVQQLTETTVSQEKEITLLKKLNAELEASLDISKKLVDLHKTKRNEIPQKLGITKLIDSAGDVLILNPTQGKINFPETRSALTATPVNTREKSVYYKMAERRAKRIYDVYCKDPEGFILDTSHIVPWVNKFFLKPGEKLTLSHIEYACLPKCYAGLGIDIGIQLYNWAQKNKNFVK